MANMSKNAFGSRENIEAAKASGAINEYDILYLDNGEIGWLDKAKNTVINTPRTQDDITVFGASDIGMEDGSVIESGKTLDEVAVMIFKDMVPSILAYINKSIGNESPDITNQLEQCLTESKEYTDSLVANLASEEYVNEVVANSLEITEF